MIAKYRKSGCFGEWYLTDFTMEQVEGRLSGLESALAEERRALAQARAELVASETRLEKERGRVKILREAGVSVVKSMSADGGGWKYKTSQGDVMSLDDLEQALAETSETETSEKEATMIDRKKMLDLMLQYINVREDDAFVPRLSDEAINDLPILYAIRDLIRTAPAPDAVKELVEISEHVGECLAAATGREFPPALRAALAPFQSPGEDV